jgi:hypothetical protein
VLHKRPTGPHRGDAPEDYFLGLGPAEQVVADSEGNVAWIVGDFVGSIVPFREGRRPPNSFQVRAISNGTERVLASGPDVDPHVLRLHDGRLSWEQGGVKHASGLR